MPDTITTIPLDEIVTAVREAGATKVAFLAANSDGPDWPNICIDNDMPKLANVRRVTALRMAMAVRVREIKGNESLVAAIRKVGVPTIARVVAGTSPEGWMRACDEARAVHLAFGDDIHALAWSKLAKNDLADVAVLVAEGLPEWDEFTPSS
jgi:hypothetical protein